MGIFFSFKQKNMLFSLSRELIVLRISMTRVEQRTNPLHRSNSHIK